MTVKQKKLIGTVVLCCGIGAVILGFLIPAWPYLFPQENETAVGIIGGADYPTQTLIFSKFVDNLTKFIYIRFVGYALIVLGFALRLRKKRHV